MKNVIIASLILASTSVLANGQAIFDERYTYATETMFENHPSMVREYLATYSAARQLINEGYAPFMPEEAMGSYRKLKAGQEAMANGVEAAADNCPAYRKALNAGFGSFYGTEQAAQGGVGGDRGLWAAICDADSSDVIETNAGTRIVFSGMGEYDAGYISVDTSTAGLWRPTMVRLEKEGFVPFTASGMKAYPAAMSLIKGGTDVIGGSVANGGLDHVDGAVVEQVLAQMAAINGDMAGVELYVEKATWLKAEHGRLMALCASAMEQYGTEDSSEGVSACRDVEEYAPESFPDADTVRAAIAVLKSAQ